jgi:hypothetical protein
MPIPGEVNNASNNMWMFVNRRIGKQTKLSLLPRRCYLTSKSLWLKKSIEVTCMITGPGEPLFESYWCDPNEFLIFEMKR